MSSRDTRAVARLIALLVAVSSLSLACAYEADSPTLAPETRVRVPATSTATPRPATSTATLVPATRTQVAPTRSAALTPTSIAPPASPALPTLPARETVELIRDVPYVVEGDVKQKLDIYLPASQGERLPVLLALHPRNTDKTQMSSLAQRYAGQGYAVLAFNYRDMPRHNYPSPVQDAFCALAWTHANAAQYGFDADRIVALGHSMGGGLVAMLGTVDDPARFLDGCPHTLGARDARLLQGVIAFAGVFDYESRASSSEQNRLRVNTYIGADIDTSPELWAEASAITWVDGQEPPFLLIHGTADAVVPPDESTNFAAALQDAGSPGELLLVPNANHTFIVSDRRALDAVDTFLETLSQNPVALAPPSNAGDGSQIVFYSNRDGNPEIYAVNVDGSGLKQLTTNSAGDMGPAWSPDGTQIAFVSDRDGNREIYVMNADGSELRRLTHDSAYDSHPDWSPDGTRLAFVSERDGNREIYTMGVDGHDIQRLTHDPADDMRPDWSPDGAQILFNSERDGNWEIYRVGADGSDLRRITDSLDWEIFPVWSPDGMQIAYRCSAPREWGGDVCIMNADGSAERRLTRHPGNDENPAWSPDGKQIVFQSDRYADPQTANTANYNFEILVIDGDGSNVRRMTDNTAGDYWPDWGSSAALVPPRPAAAQLGSTWVRPADGMVMVFVPAGTFLMGSSAAEVEALFAGCEQGIFDRVTCERAFFEHEAPQHSVSLDSFWVDRTEVTNAQYALCVSDGGCKRSRLARNAIYNGDDYPVAGVPWQDAADYCAWTGSRLATEAEWEYAARGSEGRVFPWGNTFDCAGGNFGDDLTGCDDGYAHTAPVGSFPAGASWCGALDIAGNVWEWVSDKFGAYDSSIQTNPTGPTAGDRNVLRGGSWGYGQVGLRATFRYPVPPEADYLGVGFRCVVSPQE